MRIKSNNRELVNGRRATQLLALFILLYALADVSVLQAYCGNEAVGIPPAHHLTENSGNSVNEKKEIIFPKEQVANQRSQEGQDSDRHSDDDECFCCCSHVIAGSFCIASYSFSSVKAVSRPDTYKDFYSDSILTHLLRPPQTA